MRVSNNRDKKACFFMFLARGGIWQTLTKLTKLTKPAMSPPLGQLLKVIWSIFFLKLTTITIIFRIALRRLVNLVNFFPYTPPLEHKRGKKLVNFGQFGPKTLTTQLTTHQESTTYRGHFLVIFIRTPKAFKRNTALQRLGLSPFGQFFRLEKRKTVMPQSAKIFRPSFAPFRSIESLTIGGKHAD